jgi:hypothetical protein
MSNINEEILKSVQRQMVEVDKLLLAQRKAMESQIDIVTKLGEALKNSKLAEASDDIKDLSNALSHTVKESENVGNTKTKLNLFSKSIKDNKKQTDLFRKTLNDVTKKDFALFVGRLLQFLGFYLARYQRIGLFGYLMFFDRRYSW